MRPEDIVLTRFDKFKIFWMAFNEVIPWPFVLWGVSVTLGNHIYAFNHFPGYANDPMTTSVVFNFLLKAFICFMAGALESVAVILLILPIGAKMEKEWESCENRYRRKTLEKIDETILQQKR